VELTARKKPLHARGKTFVPILCH